jgi:hypothetical protein
MLMMNPGTNRQTGAVLDDNKITHATYKASDRSICNWSVVAATFVIARFPTLSEVQHLRNLSLELTSPLMAESELSNASAYCQSFNGSPRPTASSAKSTIVVNKREEIMSAMIHIIRMKKIEAPTYQGWQSEQWPTPDGLLVPQFEPASRTHFSGWI